MKQTIKDLTGQKFGLLTALTVSDDRTTSGGVKWLCKCDCGNTKLVAGSSLTSGNSKSCGCIRLNKFKEWAAKPRGASGLRKHPLYTIWYGMIERCHNPKDSGYHNYGSRGIKVCSHWKESLQNFIDDMDPRPLGGSIERINNDADYEPKNCTWATKSEQARNTRQNRHITYKGEKLTIAGWAERTGMKFSTIKNRANKGMTPEAILETPVNLKYSKTRRAA